MTWQESLKNRARNLFFFSVWFIPCLGLFALAGWTTAPVTEYLFYYAIGIVIGIPLWVGIDLLRAKRK